MKKQIKRTLFSIFLLVFATFTTLTGMIGSSIGVVSTLGDDKPVLEPDPNPLGKPDNTN